MKKAFLLAFSLLLLCNFSLLAKKKIRVACIGDSITWGSAIKNRAEECYPVKLQALLGDKYEVRNFGDPGRCIIKTSRRGREPRAFMLRPNHKKALEFKPNIVICNLGINDIMEFSKKTEQFIPDYKELLTEYRTLKTKPKIIIWTELAPLMKGQNFFGSPDFEKINEALKKTRKQLNAEKVRKKYKKISFLKMTEPLNDRKFISGDHIHPNAAGATVIADVTYKKLIKLKLAKAKK